MRFLAALLLALVSTPALAADTGMLLAGVSRPSASAYTGPGDIVSGATAFYGLRAYSAAVAATGTQKAVNVRRASDNATQDILILTNGNLDVASAATFAGTDATATCSTAGSSTTLACTGASSTPHTNDPISGVGITQPTYLVSCGAFTAGAGSCTMNVAQNIGVAETVTFQVALFATKIYDQSNAVACSGAVACDMPQSTAGLQPFMLINCISNLPCLSSLGATRYFPPATLAVVNSAPITFAGVSIRDVVVSYATIIGQYNGSGGGLGYSPSSNTAIISSGGILPGVASDGIWHSLQGVSSGASSILTVDGTDTPGTTAPFVASAFLQVLADNTSSDILNGRLSEVGLWRQGFSSGNRTSMCHNQFTYWGTATSC